MLKTIKRNARVASNTYNATVAAIATERAALGVAAAEAKHTATALRLAQVVAQRLQNHAHAQIAGLVTRCLAAVFPDPYEFHIHFDRKRGKTEARMVFRRDGHEVDPLTASGGGVVDVAAFALRLAALVLSQPPRRRVLILDEPFRCLSENYRPAFRQLIETLAEELGVQFIIVTHIRELMIGRVIDLNEVNATN